MRISRWALGFAPALLVAGALAACGEKRETTAEQTPRGGAPAETSSAGGTLVLYSGRSEHLVEPVIARFEQTTGVDVQVKYGNTAELALTLREEGPRGQADVFWAQDAGALGAIAKAGLFVELPGDLVDSIPAVFRHASGLWVATSGRARTLAYSSDRVHADALPSSVFDLADPRFRGKVGWAPANASFQAFVTALRKTQGEEKAKAWLEAMKANGARAYANNVAILQAITRDEIDYGLPNHYYLLNFKKTEVKFPVEQTFFAPGDPGNLINVAGVGILATGRNRAAAERFVRFLLSAPAQQFFAGEVSEYPVIEGVLTGARLTPRDELLRVAAPVTLDDLDDLDGTLALLRAVGLL
jgi:iron(III) transport system substrate-binding protein